VAGTISGFSLAYTAVGGVVLWSGIKGWSISDTFKALLTGTTPTSSSENIPVGGTSATAASGAASNSSNLTNVPGTNIGPTTSAPSSTDATTALQEAAAARGWGTGSEWTALQNVEMAEAGFNPEATNASSGAFGLAQALGHGTSGTACPSTGVNEYGGYGLTDAQAQGANCGDAGDQALWMVNYIADTYGDPEAAWAHEQSAGWY
jgi:resuscitation-promoting factor RpfB